MRRKIEEKSDGCGGVFACRCEIPCSHRFWRVRRSTGKAKLSSSTTDDVSPWPRLKSPPSFVLPFEQSCWCLSFREWARDSGLLWFPAVLLAGTTVCLGGAHHVLRGALMAGDMSTLQYILVHLPVRYGFLFIEGAGGGGLTCFVLWCRPASLSGHR